LPIESNWDGELRFSGRPLPNLKGIDVSGRVIYAGVFSKTMFPAPRLGFLLSSERLAESFRKSRDIHLTVPTCNHAELGEFIAEGHFTTHIRRLRKFYAERHKYLIDCGRRKLSRWLDIVPTTMGMHIVAFLRPGFDVNAVAAAMLAGGITVALLARFCIDPMEQQGQVLGFSAFSPVMIEGAVDRMAPLFADIDGPRVRSRRAYERNS
jgi:GntR family transcriptional regulator/MocR family aminotransferase